MIDQDRLLTDEIGRGIMRVRRLIFTEAGKRLQAERQSMLAWQALAYLDHLGMMPQVALAEGLGQHAAGISRLVQDLVRDRLVSRKKAVNDRRVVLVKLSRKGKARLEAGRPLVEDAVEQILDPLDRYDRRMLRNLLWRMIPQK
ncbi:MAG: MarR family winged helix-turn-helix transcriptional regulator [Myxococcales bacterium]|nr:MarR family winged helix-turn-helix transcriptional regulator [Myxococcales bacterium]